MSFVREVFASKFKIEVIVEAAPDFDPNIVLSSIEIVEAVVRLYVEPLDLTIVLGIFTQDSISTRTVFLELEKSMIVINRNFWDSFKW